MIEEYNDHIIDHVLSINSDLRGQGGYPMDHLSTNRRVFRALSLWYLCVVFLLLLQLLIVLAWSFFGPLGNGLERFFELVYASPVSLLGNSFFEDRMTLGNTPLGMGLLLLVVILYAFLGGTLV